MPYNDPQTPALGPALPPLEPPPKGPFRLALGAGGYYWTDSYFLTDDELLHGIVGLNDRPVGVIRNVAPRSNPPYAPRVTRPEQDASGS